MASLRIGLGLLLSLLAAGAAWAAATAAQREWPALLPLALGLAAATWAWHVWGGDPDA